MTGNYQATSATTHSPLPRGTVTKLLGICRGQRVGGASDRVFAPPETAEHLPRDKTFRLHPYSGNRHILAVSPQVERTRGRVFGIRADCR